MSTEEWRPVPDFEGLYEVSSYGRVRSLPRAMWQKNARRFVTRGGRVLVGCVQAGYRQVTITKRGRYCVRHVHTLVAAAFLGARPAGMLICHKDGVSLNNASANLRYDSPQGNSDDMKLHGTVLRGERHGYAKLDTADVIFMREIAPAFSRPELAGIFGVCLSQVENILLRRQWKHVP